MFHILRLQKSNKDTNLKYFTHNSFIELIAFFIFVDFKNKIGYFTFTEISFKLTINICIYIYIYECAQSFFRIGFLI